MTTRFTTTPMYEALVGSHAYGLAGPGSDKDYLRIVVPTPTEVLGPERKDRGKQTTSDEQDETTYSLRHFIGLCAKANPNTPVILQAAEWSGNGAVRSLYRHVVSVKLVRQMLAYATGQAQRYLNDPKLAPASRIGLVMEFEYDTKAAYHVARLYGQANAITLDRDSLPLDPSTLAFCKAIRNGEVPLSEWMAYLSDLAVYEEMIMRSATRNLPQEPNYEALADASIQLHRAAWRW